MLAEPLNTEADCPLSRLKRADGLAVEWVISPAPVSYPEAVAEMEARVAAIRAGDARERVWLLEHPALYTAGVSARDDDLLSHDLPVHRTGRGGQFTYHGPGQRVAYVMLDLDRRGRDVRQFVRGLEQWIIGALAHFNIEGEVRDGRVGVWVARSLLTEAGSRVQREDKIAAIGVKVRRWVSFHGISLNVEPDLSHFAGIVPCGIREHGVTSLVDLGLPVGMDDADAALKSSFEQVFGPVSVADSINWADQSAGGA
ncbi:MAG: lipoyl(octanoyl) transferase LipB [Brevundimonas sp.]|uniref:lipoyl(octanoyl) transferase LipB n=1 Tax=Brevundimonas sp. TaxID=1871086 RepID=UPI003919B821